MPGYAQQLRTRRGITHPSFFLELTIAHAQAVDVVLPKISPTTASPTATSSRSGSAPRHVTIVDPAFHEVSTTPSRRITSPDDFIHAVRWALKHGFHPKANATTLRVAEALAAKTNRHGHLGYGRIALAEQLGLSVNCIAAHTRTLRELGLLAWVEHGSKANVLRTRNPHQQPTMYKATGTIFALVAPPAYDSAHGRRIEGTGYHARLVAVSDRGRRHETRIARAAARRSATRPTAGRRTPPSRSGFALKEVPKAQGEITYTRARARDTTSPPHHLHRVPPTQAREFIQASEFVQTQVSWLRGTCSRRLAYLLRGRLLAGATPTQLAQELRIATSVLVRRPLAYLADYLRRFPTRRVSEHDRADMPQEWIHVPVQAARPSPIPLRPLISRRFLQPTETVPDSLTDDPELTAAWEDRQVALAIARTLDYWRQQDADRGHPWDQDGDDDPFGLPRDRDMEWIPVYG
ncbi:hypothetical protein ACWEQL_26790 [Kitasatospora sp. NPDC004240]